jgi:hypothetical protein
MSWRASAYVKKLIVAPNGKRVTRSEKLLLLVIADYYNDSFKKAWPGIPDLVRDTMLSRRRIQELQRSCERKGIIKILPNAKGNGASDYNSILFLELLKQDEGEGAKTAPPGRGGSHGEGAGNRAPRARNSGVPYKEEPPCEPPLQPPVGEEKSSPTPDDVSDVIVPEIVTDDDETLSPNDDFENGKPLGEHNPLLLAVVEVLALNLDTCSERKRLKAQECCERLREMMPGISDKARAIQVEGFGPWFVSRSGFQDGIPYPSQLIDDWPRYRREIEQASKPQLFARAALSKSALNAMRDEMTDELLKLGGNRL